MGKKITALEISKRLPMKVKSLHLFGMFHGETIHFQEVKIANNYWALKGQTVGGKELTVFDKVKEFGELDATNN